MPDTALLRQLFAHEQVFLLPDIDVSPEEKTADLPPAVAVAEAVVADEPAPPPMPAEAKQQPTAGAFLPPKPGIMPLSHKVLLLVDGPSEEDLTLLGQILQSVGYTRENTDLLDVAVLRGQPLKPELLQKSVHHFISFGVPLKRIGLQLFLMHYQPRPVENIQFMLSHPLAELQADKAKKKALWQGLRLMFGL